jgi:hypothetical protein
MIPVTLNPSGDDPITGFIFSLKGKKLLIMYLLLSAFPLIAFILAIIDGNFNNSSMNASLIHDYGDIALYLFGFPVTVIVAVWYAHKLPVALNKLKENKVILISEDDWENFIGSANKIYSKKSLNVIPYIISLVITIFLVYSYISPIADCWYCLSLDHKPYLAALTMIPVYYLTFLSFSVAILFIIKTYIVLRKLFNNYKIDVQVLHPDNCGGLSSLGSLSVTLNLWIFFIGLIAAANIYMNIKLFGNTLSDMFQIMIMVGYIISAYIVFFMPLHATYKSMKNAKYDTLQRINKYFINVDKKIKEDIDNFNKLDDQDVESIESINKLYDIALKMPVYPYDLKTVSSFIGSIFVPILLFLLELVLKSFI